MILSIRLKERYTTFESHFNDMILILNPNSRGVATGKNWNDTYIEIKEYLPKQHKVILTKKADDGITIAQLIELVESYGDTINSVRDLYSANISLQMNDTTRILTGYLRAKIKL